MIFLVGFTRDHCLQKKTLCLFVLKNVATFHEFLLIFLLNANDFVAKLILTVLRLFTLNAGNWDPES